MSSSKVIAVDLDGTLTLTDTLHESVLVLVRNNPFVLFLLPFWLIKGIAYFKLKVFESCVLDVTTLPYNSPLIDWLKGQKANGKKIVLCTAANDHIAQAVAKHLDFFDDVIASNAVTNLKSGNKRNALQERYGDKGFDYAGNSSADMEVWASASYAIIVNATKAVHTKASQVASVSRIFPSENVRILDWVRALRLHQWIKNLLLFVPLLAAHQFDNFQSLATLATAFISFSLCASSVYITNDLLDLESDRRHPRKKHRAFASAKLSIALGAAISPMLICSSIVLAAIVGIEFLSVLLVYILLTVAYSLIFKRIELIDCLTLATLYTIRIFAGAAAVSLPISFWLLAFSIFIFLSLALVKRYAELIAQIEVEGSVAFGRSYKVSDAPLLQMFGISSGYISVLVIALYVHSEDVLSLYKHSTAIWLVLPILLFWISWVWLKATRGEMHDDPIIFAIKDKVSLLVAALSAVVFIYAATGLAI
jgi:4-hydroxybenzoate polyprenyltransferase